MDNSNGSEANSNGSNNSESVKTTPEKTYPTSAFFYGTLMVPQILHRVCHNGMEKDNPLYATHQFKIYPAILPNFRRHRVRDAEYPAIIPHEGASVRGTFVTGITENDVRRLDSFEGYEYRREIVKPIKLIEVGDESGKGNVEGEEVYAETYVWKEGRDRLEDSEWDFAEFQRDKLRNWVGDEGEEEYAGEDSDTT